MRSTWWRGGLLALCATSALALCYTVFIAPRFFGSSGLQVEHTRVPFVDRVTSVDPGSPAARAGIEMGDLVDARLLPPSQRYLWSFSSYYVEPGLNLETGTPLDLTVMRGHESFRARVVPVVVARASPRALGLGGAAPILGLVADLWTVLLCALIVWRRSSDVDARILVLSLISQGLSGACRPGQWRSPDPAIDAWANLLYDIGVLLFNILPLVYVLRHAGRSIVVRGLAALASAVTIAHFAVYGADIVGSWFGWFDFASLNTNAVYWNLIGIRSFPEFLVALCLIAAVPAAPPAERTAVAWVALALAPFKVSVASDWFAFTAAPFIMAFLEPVVLMYALLSRRLLDVQFVLNRAAVFTGVSIVVVGIFVLVEWALTQWFSSASHATNLAISAALALALGLSVRAIHTRVDRVLDAVFFRKRHEDEQAIRTLAREAAYITDPQILLSRIESVLEKHADATSIQLLLDDGAGKYGEVSENDPAVVRLRATQKMLDLHNVQSEIEGEFAYPMLARGRLVGALVLGPKRSGEPYAPDESDAIAQLAHDAGAALDVLEMKSQADDPLREEVRAMRELLKTLPEQIADVLERRTRLV